VLPYSRLLGLAIALLSAASLACAADLPTALCTIARQAPAIDGVLDDDAWQDAPANRVETDHEGKRPAEPPMQFRLCTDGAWLYLGAELADPDTKAYDLADRGHDACDFAHETLEVFLAPHADAPLYFQFALEPGGADYDNQSGGNVKDHNFSWRHAQTVNSDGWVA